MKKKNILVIYFIIIAIILALIMFILPDDVFLRKYKDIIIPSSPTTTETIKKEFLDYETQIENLINNNYRFEYNIMDSMGTKTYQYKCTGTKEGIEYSGTCSGESNFTYTNENKDEHFKIDTTYLNVQNIIDLIKTSEPTMTEDNETREYLYNVKIDDLNTEIIVYTDLTDINKIEISSAYMVYVLKYTSLS